MKKLAVAGVLLLTVLAYYAWPLFGLQKISQAVYARDAAELAQRINRAALRRSLTDQIGRAYLAVSGKDKGLSELQIMLAVRVAAAAADREIEALLEPQAIIGLLNESGTGAYAQLGVSAPRLEFPNLQNFHRALANTERFGRDFSIIVPFSADERTGYRLHLRLEDWTWKLVGIGLPETARMRIAREIHSRTG